MSGSPWLKFYPSDWRSDPALRMCGLAARGLWMEMLAIMHEASPRGNLLINGNEVTPKILASLCGVSLEDVNCALSELENAGVFSRKKNGIIYSRRMEKEENISRKRMESGKKGGNPSLCNKKENECLDKQNSGILPEARYQNIKKEISNDISKQKNSKEILGTVLPPGRAADVIDHRKKLRKPLGVRAAELLAAKLAAAPQTCGLSPEQAADLMIERGWLSFNPAWAENSSNPSRFSPQPAVLSTDDAAWERRLKFARDRRVWSVAEWGPVPGKSGCRVPKHLLAENDGKNWQEQGNDP